MFEHLQHAIVCVNSAFFWRHCYKALTVHVRLECKTSMLSATPRVHSSQLPRQSRGRGGAGGYARPDGGAPGGDDGGADYGGGPAPGVSWDDNVGPDVDLPAPNGGPGPGYTPGPGPSPSPRPDYGPGPSPAPTPGPGYGPGPSPGPTPGPGYGPGPSPRPTPGPGYGPGPSPRPTPGPGYGPGPSPGPSPGTSFPCSRVGLGCSIGFNCAKFRSADCRLCCHCRGHLIGEGEGPREAAVLNSLFF